MPRHAGEHSFFAVTANKLKCKLHKIVAVLAAVLGKKEVSGWALVDLYIYTYITYLKRLSN